MTLSATLFGLPSPDRLELLRAIRRVQKVSADEGGYYRDDDGIFAQSIMEDLIETLSEKHGRKIVINEIKKLTRKLERIER